ncbi:hypothetical protein [Natronorubrum sp. FCH18a]|uniref:hypothetical protein n=1 Tax=Natronorubrum sp. FCH18a TaxID=3447018 RepID=UPI003F512932
MSTDQEQTTTSLTFPSDAIETALDELPPGTITDAAESYARECGTILDGHYYSSGRSPSGLAAATIYLSSLVANQPAHRGSSRTLSQDEAANYCGVSPVTVRQHYRKILDLHEESPDVNLHGKSDERESTPNAAPTNGDLP